MRCFTCTMLVDEVKRLMMSRTQAWLLALNQNGCEAKAEVAMRWLANKVADSHKDRPADCPFPAYKVHSDILTLYRSESRTQAL